jgi:hypothetical protein
MILIGFCVRQKTAPNVLRFAFMFVLGKVTELVADHYPHLKSKTNLLYITTF